LRAGVGDRQKNRQANPVAMLDFMAEQGLTGGAIELIDGVDRR
jgi:hypothetical protein